MRIGILTRNRNSWSSTQLQDALRRHHVPCVCFNFSELVARVAYKPYFNVRNIRIFDELDAMVVRPIGRGSLEEIIFRMNMLRRLERLGLYVVNPPEAIEQCADKYSLLSILEENDIPVPRTAATESAVEALKVFHELGEDVIVKPLFGSRGIGSTRINDMEVATTIFRALAFHHTVIHLQEFIPHGFSDIRAFVIGDQVVAAMKRMGNTWKTNYSQGAKPVLLKLDRTLKKMAIKSANLSNCKIAGVDILDSSRGPLCVEVNSQPGWKGLQSVNTLNIAEKIVDFVTSELKR
ncbi:RimK family alpha-L-glutamate ligase [Candidatus Bathyarchaeota archaeon]|nr:RimK family alpha-L-glutamate ligase [Candidatus Bathyarchaeota archaeon]